MREFVVPKVDTKHIGEVKLDLAFQIVMQLDKPSIIKTPHGGRVYQAITGGRINGPKFNGTVYADGGGEYGLVRADNVHDLNTHFMMRDERGEWVYVAQSGYYRAKDNYYRVMAYFDAEKTGRHAWLNDSVLVATAQVGGKGQEVTFKYYEAL